MAEPLTEVPRPHTRHPERRHRPYLLEREGEHLADDYRIDVRVERAGAVPGLEQGDRLVQVVHHRRVVLEEHPVHGARRGERLLVRVAVDVDEDVAAPVRRGLARQAVVVGAAREVAMEPVGHLVAAVRLGHRIDEDQHLLPDVADHRLLGDRQPIGEFHGHLGAARLVGVQAGIEVVDRPRAGDDPLRLVRSRRPRIRQRRRGRFQPRQVADARLVGDHDEQDVAAFFRLTDRLDVDARRGARQLAHVALDGGRMRQLAGRADDVPEKHRR
jgi:hypothetical protein